MTPLWEMWKREMNKIKSKAREAFFVNSDAAGAHFRHIHCLDEMPGRETRPRKTPAWLRDAEREEKAFWDAEEGLPPSAGRWRDD